LAFHPEQIPADIAVVCILYIRLYIRNINPCASPGFYPDILLHGPVIKLKHSKRYIQRQAYRTQLIKTRPSTTHFKYHSS